MWACSLTLTIIPTDLPLDSLAADGWQLASKTPGLTAAIASQSLTLPDSDSVVFVRQAQQ